MLELLWECFVASFLVFVVLILDRRASLEKVCFSSPPLHLTGVSALGIPRAGRFLDTPLNLLGCSNLSVNRVGFPLRSMVFWRPTFFSCPSVLCLALLKSVGLTLQQILPGGVAREVFPFPAIPSRKMMHPFFLSPIFLFPFFFVCFRLYLLLLRTGSQLILLLFLPPRDPPSTRDPTLSVHHVLRSSRHELTAGAQSLSALRKSRPPGSPSVHSSVDAEASPFFFFAVPRAPLGFTPFFPAAVHFVAGFSPAVLCHFPRLPPGFVFFPPAPAPRPLLPSADSFGQFSPFTFFSCLSLLSSVDAPAMRRSCFIHARFSGRAKRTPPFPPPCANSGCAVSFAPLRSISRRSFTPSPNTSLYFFLSFSIFPVRRLPARRSTPVISCDPFDGSG